MRSVTTSIIIPLYGGLDLTQACHAALLRTLAHRSDIEIVYVDNASPDDTRRWLAGLEDPRVKRVLLDHNANFSGGCNAGVRAARGANIVLLNNDTETCDGWLDPLETALESPSTGVAGALLTYPDDSVQHAGVVVPAGELPQHAHVGCRADDPVVRRPRVLQAVTAACCAIRRDTWTLLGGLDEGYVNGMEDMDLCWRARARGLQIRYEPSARIVHHESKSAGRFAHARENIERFVARHGRALVPDAHVFDELAEAPPATHMVRISCSATCSSDLARAPADTSVAAADHALAARLDATTDTLWVPEAVLERVGGFDMRLSADVRWTDWLDRLELCGVRIDGAQRERAFWSDPARTTDDEARRAVIRRWGSVAPHEREQVRLEPLCDEPQVLDARVELALSAQSALVSTIGDGALYASARAAFLQVPPEWSVVVRVDSDDDYDVLDRAAEGIADNELPDVVIIPAGPELELVLARECTNVFAGADPSQIRRLRSIAHRAGTLISGPRPG